jgi:hypothetical protein
MYLQKRGFIVGEEAKDFGADCSASDHSSVPLYKNCVLQSRL